MRMTTRRLFFRVCATCLLAVTLLLALLNGKKSLSILIDETKENKRSTKLAVVATKATTTEVLEWSAKWPRVNLKNCSHMEYMNKGINSVPLAYPRTGIVSSPGNGNTWTRHLIQQATGLWTGSVFADSALYKGNFKGEKEDCNVNSTVAIKAHQPQNMEKEGCIFERVVLVLRDSHRGLLAEFNRQKGKGHTGVADDTFFKDGNWTKFVKGYAGWHATMNLLWIGKYQEKGKVLSGEDSPFTAPPETWSNLLLVSYERMKSNPVKELGRIVKFLGLPVFREHCLKEDSEGKFKRPPKSGAEIACYYRRPEEKEAMKKAIEILSQGGRKKGVGNMVSEFEGIDKHQPAEHCAY